MKINKVQFERDTWHPLDHWIGSARCIAFQFTKRDSIRTHARYWWEFKRDDDWSVLYRVLCCSWGHHKMRTWHRNGSPEINEACAWCPKQSGWHAP